ncbi:hypothetical protein [Noviherbaspirillum pedocola]|uniref:Uncharacterized protein n=1 Tax=Noviherbaspirillum pedocola TaxID=2801341 RepID=A0A934W8T0_9BURK|nr:hypothetical protein [Noviherbaspirillum pedocola]MBK4736194.1 hypothetical protein [Noviherbaspirillum pedocola]
MKNKLNRLVQKLALGGLLGAFFGTCAVLTIDLFSTSFLHRYGIAVIGMSIILLAVAAALCPEWMFRLYGASADVMTLRREPPETVLSRLRYVIGQTEGGLDARINACIEMRALLAASAPELLAAHSNLLDWLAANERYLRQIASALPRERNAPRNPS